MIAQVLTWSEIRTLLVLSAMLLIPGWAFLSVTGLWRRWKTLQRWCLVIGIGISFYPLLFYWARQISPDLTLGTRKLTFLLALLALAAIWGLRKNWKQQFSFDGLEWAAIAVFVVTVFTRIWFVHLNPYPAWSDSLHHTLLTQLTAQSGRLPLTMEPYEPVALTMYHLGLYALSGSAQLLANIPAPKALLWVSQLLNGLCGLGVFFVLDHRVGRKAALVGIVFVGLLSFQPAWYVNWGRFTQVASQTILLIGWIVTWEALRVFGQPGCQNRMALAGLTLAAAVLNGGIFLLHFRVAAFYFPLILFSFVWELIQAGKHKAIMRVLRGTAAVGAVSLIAILPVFIEAVRTYLNRSEQPTSGLSVLEDPYYQFAERNIFSHGLQPWVFWLAAACLLFLVIRRSKFGIAMAAWSGILWAEGHAYLLNIPALAFTNYGAVVILFYLPAALIIGAAVEELFRLIPRLNIPQVHRFGLAFLAVAGFVGAQMRTTGVQSYRHFMTAADELAMVWINENTPPDALFAINTFMWLDRHPHGTDGGYWIPYYTNRKTTTGTMMYDLGDETYRSLIVEQSRAVKHTEEAPAAITELCIYGVDYLYIGEKGNFSPPGLTLQEIQTAPGTVLVYQHGAVSIFRICQ